MKIIKKTIFIALVSLIIFSFKKVEETRLNILSINVAKLLIKQKFDCRPSSKFMFYVDTDIVKKSRGYSTIKASIYIYERATGKSGLLASENIMSPIQRDAILEYTKVSTNHCGNKTLSNGDKIIGNMNRTEYCFSELMSYKTIYNSYIKSRNKLLNEIK